MSLDTYLPALLWMGTILWIAACIGVAVISDSGEQVFRRFISVTAMFMIFFGGFAAYGIEKWSA